VLFPSRSVPENVTSPAWVSLLSFFFGGFFFEKDHISADSFFFLQQNLSDFDPIPFCFVPLTRKIYVSQI